MAKGVFLSFPSRSEYEISDYKSFVSLSESLDIL